MLLLIALMEHVRQVLGGVILLETADSPGLQALNTFGGLIRAASHLCAPGFFFIVGIGIVLWSRRHGGTAIDRWKHFLKRAALLVLAQLVLENAGWSIPLLRFGWPEIPGGVPLYLGVLFSLGLAMVAGCAVFSLPSYAIASIGVLMVLSPAIASRFALPESVAWLCAELSAPGVDVLFPPVPWAGMTLLGMVFARIAFSDDAVAECRWRMRARAHVFWPLMLAICTLVTAYGSAILWKTAFHKYPPSPLHSFGMLASVAAMCALFASASVLNLNALRLLGRNSLAAYLTPIYIAGIAVALGGHRHGMAAYGITLGVAWAATAAVCLLLERGRDNFSFFAPGYDAFMRRFGLYRIGDIEASLNGVAAGASLLDVAGGTGYIAKQLSGRFGRVVVVDLSEGMLDKARKHGVETVRAPASALPFADGEFDVVMCVDALHHIQNAEEALDEMVRVLKTDGTLLIQDFRIDGVGGFIFLAFERVLLDNSRFVDAEALSEIMADKGIDGRVRMLKGLNYIFNGKKTG